MTNPHRAAALFGSWRTAVSVRLVYISETVNVLTLNNSVCSRRLISALHGLAENKLTLDDTITVLAVFTAYNCMVSKILMCFCEEFRKQFIYMTVLHSISHQDIN